jgi:transposase
LVSGRPSIDPEPMVPHAAERRFCDEVHLNLDYRWLCRLGLEASVPNHSTFSRTRHGRVHESDLFRPVFEHVVGACMQAGLVQGDAFAIAR